MMWVKWLLISKDLHCEKSYYFSGWLLSMSSNPTQVPNNASTWSRCWHHRCNILTKLIILSSWNPTVTKSLAWPISIYFMQTYSVFLYLWPWKPGHSICLSKYRSFCFWFCLPFEIHDYMPLIVWKEADL